MKPANWVASENEMAPTRNVDGLKVFDICHHKHSLTGTAVFFQSLGVLQCNKCGGYQAIRKPI